MKFQVIVLAGAQEDIKHYRVHEQRIIVDAIVGHLSVDAHVPSRRRKQLRPNALAPWELRNGIYRVFYEIEDEAVVRVVAVGHKAHNELLIRGRTVEL